MIASDNPQAEVTDYFERDSGFWESVYGGQDVFSVIHRERAARAMSEIGRLPLLLGSKVLEVGCGAGLTAIRLARRGFLVEATDSTPAMVERTRLNAAHAQVTGRLAARVADAHHLEYADQSFDLVLALGVLPWLHSPDVGLAEMSRVLRPGGYLVANTDNRARLTHLLDPLFNPLLQPVRRGLGRGRATGASTRPVWSRRFDRALSQNGLRKERGFTFGFGPFTMIGRTAVPGRAAVRLHSKLQQLADEGLPILRSTGAQYLVVARKTG